MPPDLRTAGGPHVFVVDLDAPELAADDRHHLERSLRMRSGDELTISDGAFRWRRARFGEALEPLGPIHIIDPPAHQVGLAVSLTKGTKPEFVVQKATELGIDHVIVFQATHSVVRWDTSRRTKARNRLERVAREAAMQSRQVKLPTISVVEHLAEAVDPSLVARADFGGIAMDSSHHMVAIGPEGGWADDERRQMPTAVDLGGSVLRAETAAVVASAHLVSHRRQIA